MRRLILEMGMGNDLYGMDYTKASKRAVEDAFRHSTLSIFNSLNLDSSKMQVKVTVAVVEPEKVDCEAVAKVLPRGVATALLSRHPPGHPRRVCGGHCGRTGARRAQPGHLPRQAARPRCSVTGRRGSRGRGVA